MKKIKLLDKESLFSKLFSPVVGYSSDLVILPNFMLVYWASSSHAFQLRFPLDTSDNINDFAYWWLTSPPDTHFSKYEVLEYFVFNCHRLDLTGKNIHVLTPTKLMELVWRHRPDLQKTFPDIYEDDCSKFWGWWVARAAFEYNITSVLPPDILFAAIHHQDIGEILIGIIWRNNKELQYEFPGVLADKSDFILWWNSSGLFQYFIDNACPEQIEPYHRLEVNDEGVLVTRVTPLMELVWVTNPELRRMFPKIKHKDGGEYWAWWLTNASNYKVPSVLPVNLFSSSIMQSDLCAILMNFIWLKQPDLQKIFPNSSIVKEDFMGFCESLVKQKYLADYEGEYVDFDERKVAVIGHHNGVNGLGEDARLISEALRMQGYKVELYSANDSESEKGICHLGEYKQGYVCNIFCLPAFDMLKILVHYGLDVFIKSINVGLWQWELEKFPVEASYAFELVHEILTISHYSSKSISPITDKPVSVLNLPVKDEPIHCMDRQSFGLPDEKFLFFFSFDGDSFINRKNPLGVIEAFQRAFPINENDSNVGLVIKVINAPDHQMWNECLRRIYCDERIYVMEKTMRREKYLGLLGSIDAMISLHRCEGFGRFPAEAFIARKPIISSAYSGNMDFMNDDNSCLVSGKMVSVFSGEYMFYKGNLWFEPDLSIAAEKMRMVFQGGYPRSKLDAAYKMIKDNYSLSITGNQLNNLIEKNSH